MAGNKDFIDIIREIRGSAAPGQPLTDGIWYELTVADKNGNPGVYGDILAKYGVVTESAGTFDQAVAILENLNVEITTLPAGSNATSALVNGVWQIGLPRGTDGTDGNDGNTPELTMTYDAGNIKYTVTVDGVVVTNTNLINLDTLVDSKVSTNVGVQETLEAKQDVLDAVATAQGISDSLDANVVAKKQEIAAYTNSKINEIGARVELEKTELDIHATTKVNEYNANALNKLNQYNDNHTNKLSVYNSNDTLKLNQYNENHIERLNEINYAYADRIIEMIKTRNFMGIMDEYVAKTDTHMITFLDTTDANYVYYANGTLLVENVDYTVYNNTTIELTVKANPYDVIVQVNTQVLNDILTVEGVLFDDRLGQPNGVASLNVSGKVPSEQLPSYVDDVIEVNTYADLPVVGESSKVYVVIVDETSNGDTTTYRWTGTVYAVVSNTLNASDVKALYEANPDTNAYTDAEKSKLADIEDGATGDQTASEILTLLKTVDGSGSGIDADLLDGQEGAYYLNASNINTGTIDDARLPDTITSDITGNAATTTKLATARTITLTGDVTGSVSFDGSANVSITATVADDSHNHVISNVDGLQVALDSKVDKVSKQSLDSNSALRVSGTTVSLYKGDGTFDSITTQDTVYTLPTATSTVKGGIEIFSDTVQTVASNTVSTTAGRTYGIQLNSAGQAVVNVPWVDTNTVYTHPNSGVTAGTYSKVTVDAQGHVTNGTSLSSSDIPSLDASKITSGTIDPARLPSFVDDVLEFANLAGFPTTGEAGKIYIALDTNKSYRWSGSTYVYITSGAVDSVAGKTGVVTLVKADVGLGSVDNTSDLNKPISTATQTALNNKLGVTETAVAAQKLATARTINGVEFDGSANITVADSTKLPIAGGTLSGNLNISNANPVLAIQQTSSAAQGEQSRIEFKAADGQDVAIRFNTFDAVRAPFGLHIEKAPSNSQTGLKAYLSVEGDIISGGTFSGNGSGLTVLNAANLASGTIPDARLSGTYTGVNITGNASTATTLQTARTIGGVSFNGSANINLPGVNTAGNQNTTGNASTATKLATAIKINGISFDGSADITVSDNTAVKLTGNQTISGVKIFSSTIVGSINGNAGTVTNGVYTVGDQTIGGAKTFSSSPIVPTPVIGDNSTKVATTAYVIAEINKIEEW